MKLIKLNDIYVNVEQIIYVENNVDSKYGTPSTKIYCVGGAFIILPLPIKEVVQAIDSKRLVN